MRMRVLVVLATVAALLGAPSLASAAGNSLTAPSVSPSSGTVSTVFTLRVTYEGMFPATAVSVSVAGLPLPMVRISGTPEHGTWSVGTLLPAGTWTPTFTALAERGNTASLVGPAVSVAGSASTFTPAPTVSGPSPHTGEFDPGNPSSPAEPAEPAEPGDPGDPGDPGAAPAETESETQPSAAPDPAASTAAGSSSGGDGSGGGTSVPAGPSTPAGSAGGHGGEGGDGGDDPAPAPADAPRDEGSAEPAMPASGEASDREPTAIFVEDGLLNAVLLIGLSGVAAVAVIGTALLLVRRRDSREGEVPIPVSDRTATEALLERRTLRQAKVRLPDDPIVAALGIDDQVAARRQRRHARQVSGGPGERQARPTRERD